MARPGKSRRGAVRHGRPAWPRRLYRHVVLGFRHAFATLGDMTRRPVASLMTVGVIGIALALPAGFYLGLVNLHAVSRGWHAAGRATLFLEPSLPASEARALAQKLRARGDVAAVKRMTEAEALAEFKRLSGFDAALEALAANPLPAVLIVTPAQAPETAAAARQWVSRLERLEGVDMAQFDIAWLMRFQGMLAIAERVIQVSAVLLLLAVLLAVGNTIRLDIENRRSEIEVIKLLGATDRFVRRPFLYGGLWYGALGGLLAAIIVGVAVLLLAGPIERLVEAYAGEWHMAGPGLVGVLWLIGIGAAIGLAGAWLAVSRHLKHIEPL